jgi:uncharacterized RDD family membrane protein YckC
VTEVVTGEAVVLDVPCARFPSRMAALLIDLLIQIAVLIGAIIAVGQAAGHLSAAAMGGIFVSCYVVIVVGYSAIFETLTRGKTPGKMVFGLRVISDDGGPVRFRQALVRALTGAIEIWSVLGAPIGLILSIVSVKGKRLGDMFAGTYVIQERAPRRPELPPVFAAVPPPLLGWAQVAQTSRLSDQSAEAAGSYLRRFYELTPAAREDLGLRIASAVVTQVSPPPPPGTPPAAYLAAVLAVRRQHEQARLARQQPETWAAAAAPPGPAAAAPPGYAAAPPPGYTTAPPPAQAAVPPPGGGGWAAPGDGPARSAADRGPGAAPGPGPGPDPDAGSRDIPSYGGFAPPA